MATTVDQLLFAELPGVPWRDGQAKELQAVTMLQPYAYDDTAAGVPPSIRNRVHDSLKIDNLLHLCAGEQGLLYDTNPARTKGSVLFIKGAKEVLVVVPMNLLNLGSMFQTLGQNLVNNVPSWLPGPSNISVVDADNVGSIEKALLPDVRRVIQSGTFSLKDLIGLPEVDRQSEFPPEGSLCIYMRLYINPRDKPGPFPDATQADFNRNVGVYIGQTGQTAYRMRRHDGETKPNSASPHYARASKSSPEDRLAIPLQVWDDPFTPSEIIDMAEQMMILIFNSYQSFLLFFFRIVNERFLAQNQRHVYLVFEVMDDNKPHPRPWVGVPSVGPFKNFEQASSLGVRGASSGKAMTKVLEEDDNETFLAPYRDAMLIIQCLNGMNYTGPLHGHPKAVTTGSLKIKALETDHMSQNYRLVDQPRSSCPAPTMSEWEENYNLIIQEFASEATQVGLSTPPQLDDESMLCSPRDVFRAASRSGASTHPCDTCRLINMDGKLFPCERDPSDPRGCCKVCALLNRPCTYTATSDLSILVGNRNPRSNINNLFSMCPDGPFRTLYYYCALSPDDLNQVQVVPVPIEKRLGFGMEDSEESDQEEEQEQAGMEEVVGDEE
ncbi:hypothetical protein F53441_4396 [Fusarium austroafricanum]|uniref:Uncharacterized protein n=1 Tax=Fusarium austroafricanum TaxID=2364996 RepID=A0A8H4KM45_9HYPO|nr:hypothetical protein F53441_4396 [Fusarium austroafricanum]